MARSLSIVLVLLIIALSSPAGAQIYLELRGIEQGPIAGGVTDPLEPGTIAVDTVDWSSSYGLDPQTGQPGGRRTSTVVSFTKLRDPASVPMQRALGEFERLDVCAFRRYVPDPVGTRVLEMRIRLVDASLVSQDTSIDGSGAEVETWTVAYQSVVWTYEPTGEVFEDFVAPTAP
jgi:type VI secretion system Hcp family effector